MEMGGGVKGKGGAGIVERTVLINLNLTLKMSCPIITQLKYYK